MVQDVGFRSRIIGTARIYGIRGYPPVNDLDGSVKMICEGPEEQLGKFLRDIDVKEETPTGIRVEVMEKKELPVDFPLPVRFAPTATEELRSISRKLDEGVGSLKNIEASVARNTELLSRNTELLSINTDSLKGIEESLAKNTDILREMNESLPERIAQALKNVLK